MATPSHHTGSVVVVGRRVWVFLRSHQAKVVLSIGAGPRVEPRCHEGVVVPEVVGEIAAALKPDSIHLLAARQGGAGIFIAAMLLCRNKDR